MTVIVTGVIEIAPEHAEAAVAAAIEMQRATAVEDGCIEYRFWRDLEHPARFRVYEEWRDGAALKAHGATPHMAAFRAALGGLSVLSREIKVVEGGTVSALS